MMKNKFIIYHLSFIVFTLWLAGCSKPVPVPPRVDDDPKTLLMYDNIGSWFDADVAEAGRAVASGALADKGHRVVVFQRRSGGNVIYELVRDKSVKEGYRKEPLHRYAPEEVASLSVETLKTVVGKMRGLAPANHFGLAFGSHGMGWVPKNNPAKLRRMAVPDPFAGLWDIDKNGRTRYLAYSTAEKLDVSEFAGALDEWDWDFILLDDCFMASVEALYEMRDLADYFIASPTEILSTGFPYDRVVNILFRDDWTNIRGVAHNFVEYYDNGSEPYATVSVVKGAELEGLAGAVRNIRLASAGNNDVNPSVTPIQFFEGMSPHVFYDLDDYMRNFTRSVPLYEAFREQLQKAVVFAEHTDEFYSDKGRSGTYPVTHYSGLTAFIPWAGNAVLTPVYKQTAWYKAVYE